MDNSENSSLEKRISEMFASKLGEMLYCECQSLITEQNMDALIKKGVLVGFSGGADSIFLLCFLLEYKRRNSLDFNINLCHVNHMIRGAEADRDEAFCCEIARNLKIDIEVIQRDIPSLAKEFGLGIEEAARNERYEVFEKILKVKALGAISVAHNASDNAETVLFNILRGSGLKGGCGIPPVRDCIIRPLLNINGEDLRSLLNEFNIQFVLDSTNVNPDYTRNYLRSTVIPSLKKVNPDPVSAFLKFSRALREDNEYLEKCADEVLDNLSSGKIYRESLLNLPYAIFSRVFSKLVKDAGGASPSSKHIKGAYELLKRDNFSLNLPGKTVFVCQRSECFFLKESELNCDSDYSDFILPLRLGTNRLEGFNADIIIGEDFDNSSLNIYKFSIKTSLPFDIIKDGVFMRFKRDGDFYKYDGITHKLKKVFNDRDIPPRERDFIPVICDDKGILWVPGLKPRDFDSPSERGTVSVILGFREPMGAEKEIFTALKR